MYIYIYIYTLTHTIARTLSRSLSLNRPEQVFSYELDLPEGRRVFLRPTWKSVYSLQESVNFVYHILCDFTFTLKTITTANVYHTHNNYYIHIVQCEEK